MHFLDTRRGFFGQISRALAGWTIGHALPKQANAIVTQPSAESAEGEDYYEKLGVTKIINAAGTYTHLTASTMPPSVQAAVARAARHPVHLADLQRAAGEYLARRLRCEAAMVTAGAASAVTLGTAACITAWKRIRQSCDPY